MTNIAGIPSIRDLDLARKRVLIRVDLDAPFDKKRSISDDARLRASVPTIRHAMEAGAKVILAAHLGRPKPGQREPSLEPCGLRLAELLGCEVHLPEDCLGDAPRKVIQDLRDGQVCLLENLRFYEGEAQNDLSFARQLSELCDVYVNDAFGACHLPHASVQALPKLLRERGCGLRLEQELRALGRVQAPDKPFVAVLGGAQIGNKQGLIELMLERADALLIGGAIANTFLQAQGKNMQASRVEEDKLAFARSVLERAMNRKIAVLLPTDVVVGKSHDAPPQTVRAEAVPPGMMALDIGPDTVKHFSSRIDRGATILWNGPIGRAESKGYAEGTRAVASALAGSDGFTVVVGESTTRAVASVGAAVVEKIKHISVGGEAAIEYLEGRRLPGLEALKA